MAEGTGEVGVDERFKTQDFRQKIKDKRKEFIEQDAFDFRAEYYRLSIIGYPYSVINYPSITFYL